MVCKLRLSLNMLPKMLYELLPYIYLSVGVGGVSVSSALIIVGSVILMSTGVLVLFMRYSYRQSIKRSRKIQY